MLAVGRFQAGSGLTTGWTMSDTPEPTDATDSKRPMGSPHRMTMGSTRNWPRSASRTRAAQVFDVLGPSETTRPGMGSGSVEGRWTSSHGLGSRDMERSVKVIVSTSPTDACWLSGQDPASRAVKPRLATRYAIPTVMTARYSRK